MQTNSVQTNEQGYDFDLDFDINDAPPAAQPSEEPYTATCGQGAKVVKNREKFPMIILPWELTGTEDSECQESIGAEVPDFITLHPNGDKRGGFGRRKLIELCELFNLETTIVPQKIRSLSDFDPFLEAMRGQTAQVWVRANSTGRTNVYYSAPSNGAGNVDDAGETNVPVRAAAPAKKAAPKAKPVAPKKAARR